MSGPAFEGWAILELFGHIRLAGQVSEVEMFGAKCGRIDTPALEPGEGSEPAVPAQTQYFGGAAVFRVLPCTEEAARSVIRGLQPFPVSVYQPRLEAASGAYEDEDEDEELLPPDEPEDGDDLGGASP